MKVTALLALTSGLALFFACQAHKPADDPEKLKSVLLSYFDGIKTKDFAKMTESTTGDFVLYEMGRVWNNDSVFKEMKRFPYTVVYTFDDFKRRPAIRAHDLSQSGRLCVRQHPTAFRLDRECRLSQNGRGVENVFLTYHGAI